MPLEAIETPVPIQLCVQGGAAKIALLTAVMEAVEQLHDSKKLVVTNIAGTSAGAIVGTLFASGVPMATLRNRLSTAPLGKIVPRRGSARTKLALVSGRPLWNEVEFRKFLQSLLSESLLAQGENPKEILTFAHIFKHRAIKTSVVATSLTAAMPVVKKDGDAIVDALLDSAAVPFFFRAQRSKDGNTVDGGLCENLPSDQLSDNENDGPIVAISFLRTAGAAPNSVGEYYFAVVSAGIDYSADRAKRLLEERARRSSLPHDVFLINSPIDSFDFEKAVRDGLGKAYEEVREKAKNWLTAFVDGRRRQIQQARELAERARGQQLAVSRLTDYYTREMPKNLARLYKTQHQPVTLRWSHARLEVTVSPTHDSPDTLNHSAQFHTRDQPVWCHRLPLLVAGQSPATLESTWQIFGPNKERIAFYHMIMDEDGDPKSLEWLVCFETPLPARSGPYTLLLVDSVRDFMRPLRDNERDEIWVSFHRKEGLVDQVEVIAYVPETMPRIDLEPMAGAGKSAVIDDFELSRHRPPNHNFYGLRGFDIAGDRWGMHLKPIK